MVLAAAIFMYVVHGQGMEMRPTPRALVLIHKQRIMAHPVRVVECLRIRSRTLNILNGLTLDRSYQPRFRQKHKFCKEPCDSCVVCQGTTRLPDHC